MQNSEKIKLLSKLVSEDELRRELVVPLLRKMSQFTEVLDNQGPDEAGVDVIAVSASPFKKPEYTAFILKKGNITQKVADRKNHLVEIVETQIRQAIKQPLSHPRLRNERCYANRVVVLTNGTISRQAEDALRKAYQNQADLNLDFIAQDRLIEAIDEFWPEFYDDRRPFLSTYAKKLFDSLDVVDLELLGYTKAQKSLSKIYIDALLTERDNINSNEFIIEKQPILGQNLCKQRQELVVISSGPGGGKSTLLKEIAIAQSQNGHDHVAVYIHARDILESDDVISAAVQCLAGYSGDRTDVVLPEVEAEKLLLLVDGLDELASVDDRELVINKLREAKEQRKAKVILGSRPDSNPRVLAALADFTSYSILPLRYGQIRSFFGKWFGSNDKASKLLDAMQDKGLMEKLPRTPMTMTLVAIVFENKEDLPATLTELYEMFVELLTGKWDASRQINSAFDSSMKVAYLAFLAATMHRERLETIDQDRAMALAKEFFENQATLNNVDHRLFIQDIIDRSQILIPFGERQLRFSHMTFQEFFAAEYLSQRGVDGQTLLSWYGDDWWQEVLFYYAGKQQDISPVIDLLISSDHDDPESRLTKFVTLGSMLQSGSLTGATQKFNAIDFASRRFMNCYDDLVDAIAQTMKGKVKHKVSRLLLLDFLQSLFASNYTSKFLKAPLAAVYEEQSKEGGNLGSRFLLACSLEKLGANDPLLDFASDPTMVDTSMYMIGEATLSRGSAPKSHKDKFKKLEKRKAVFRKAIRKEVKSLASVD